MVTMEKSIILQLINVNYVIIVVLNVQIKLTQVVLNVKTNLTLSIINGIIKLFVIINVQLGTI
jgi:hypothetical protein